MKLAACRSAPPLQTTKLLTSENVIGFVLHLPALTRTRCRTRLLWRYATDRIQALNVSNALHRTGAHRRCGLYQLQRDRAGVCGRCRGKLLAGDLAAVARFPCRSTVVLADRLSAVRVPQGGGRGDERPLKRAGGALFLATFVRQLANPTVRIDILLPAGTAIAAGTSGALDIGGIYEHPITANGAATSAALIEIFITTSLVEIRRLGAGVRFSIGSAPEMIDVPYPRARVRPVRATSRFG